MTPTMQVDTRQFDAAMRELARISGRSLSEVIKREAVSVVKIAARKTKATSVAKIRKAVEGHYLTNFRGSAGRLSVNQRREKGRIWFRMSGAQRWYMIAEATGAGRRVPEAVWGGYQATLSERPRRIREETKRRSEARGIRMQSWVQIADSLGIDINSVGPGANVRASLARGAVVSRGPLAGQRVRNGRAFEETVGKRFAVTLRNDSPLEVKLGGHAKIQMALNQRARGFEFALKKGVFEDLKLRAKRYPGIFVSES